jgi:phosphotriesterase-related protein
MLSLITTLGPVAEQDLRTILPHEHIFVDLRLPTTPGFAQADPVEVIALMRPELEKARSAGISALVECTPVGVGRRIDILKAVSQVADFPLVAPTGVYREPWVPNWVRAASEEYLSAWMRRELDEGIEGTGVRAGFIKLSAGDDGLTAVETKILRAAARAGLATGAAIGSHTIRGWVVRDQLAVLAELGYPPEKFIWIHANAEPDFALNLEMARRGAWIEYDGIGWDTPNRYFIDRIHQLIAAGLADRILLSQDRGWFDPAQPAGGSPKPYTYIVESFLPELAESGLDQDLIWQLTHTQPFQAFAR